MKIFISADLEGVNGIVAPEDVEEVGSGYQQARVFMTEEVNAAVAGAFAGGATEVIVCDSHNVSQNIKWEQLDPRAQLIRGDSRRNSMVHGLDESFDGLILLGYHAKFGTQKAILDHTFDPLTIHDLRVNGVSMGELGFNSLYAAEKGVPLLMATGDQALAAEAKAFYPEVETAIVKYAEGRFCARCLPREESLKLIRETAERAVRTAGEKKPVSVPKKLAMEVTFQKTNLADGAMRVPGIRRLDDLTVATEAEDMETLIGLRQVVFGAGGSFYNALF
jgi:D-amino peptidase